MTSLFVHSMLLTFAWVPFAVAAWLLEDPSAEPIRRWRMNLGHAVRPVRTHRLTHA